MKNVKKIFLIIFIITITFYIDKEITFADEEFIPADVGGGIISTPPESSETKDDGGNNNNQEQQGTIDSSTGWQPSNKPSLSLPPSCTCDGGSCTPTISTYRPGIEIKWNLYDNYDNSIINQTTITQKSIAGMAVGVKLFEMKTVYWSAYGKVTYNCTCRYWVRDYSLDQWSCTKSKNGKKGGCSLIAPGYRSELRNETKYAWSSSCQETANQQAYNVAVKAVSSGASYSMTIADPNDARCATADEETAKELNCQSTTVSAVEGEVSAFPSNPVRKYYYYEMYGTCVNVKTSKVRYLNKNDKCTDEEYYIANKSGTYQTRHWHVFTPLNTKSPKGYVLKLTPNTPQRGDVCEELVEKYQNNYEYLDYIIPSSGSFVKNIKADKKIASKGCYMQTIIKVPTTQKYYGEEINATGDDSTLNGFQFYYRQIDINNPFPNGIAKDSYWKDWEDNNKKDPDIEKSYNNITYQTDGIDLNYVRDYNSNNNYTSWKGMNINGTSSFITGGKILSRSSTINQQSLYSLGCGPTNMCEYYIDSSGNRTKNPIYQPECANTRKEVSCP